MKEMEFLSWYDINKDKYIYYYYLIFFYYFIILIYDIIIFKIF